MALILFLAGMAGFVFSLLYLVSLKKRERKARQALLATLEQENNNLI